jgi:hypothetical protein
LPVGQWPNDPGEKNFPSMAERSRFFRTGKGIEEAETSVGIRRAAAFGRAPRFDRFTVLSKVKGHPVHEQKLYRKTCRGLRWGAGVE